MIITKSKPIEEILEALRGARRVFLVGCGSCAASCSTGGPEDVKAMREKLEAEGIEIVGQFVGEADCHVLDMKRESRKHKEALEQAEAVLVMACGAGAQSFIEFTDLPVYSANDTLFLGNSRRIGHFEEHCSLCGKCVLNETGGICPVTNCAKGLLNGPCGGMVDGKCEVDPDKDCAWVKIYERLEKLEQTDLLEKEQPFKDYSAGCKPAKLEVPRKAAGGKK